MSEPKKILSWLAALVVAVALIVQLRSIQQLRSELTDLRFHLVQASNESRDAVSLVPARPVPRGDSTVSQRLAGLEEAVASLTRATDYLKERGQLPLNDGDIEGARRRFTDITQSDRDRLRALQSLRRSGVLADDVAMQALAWLQTSTNANTRRTLVQQLDGATNAALKQPLLAMMTDPDAQLREEAIDALGGFLHDPQVEQALWNVLASDANEDVREQAEDALRDGPFTEARLASLHARALNPEASLTERLTAFSALEEAEADVSAVTASLTELAQQTTDPELRRQLFRAFEDVDDPAVKLPLVQGLQDQNPLVREDAVDALANFKSDPAVEQWLRYVAQNDADSTVRREAFEALEDND